MKIWSIKIILQTYNKIHFQIIPQIKSSKRKEKKGEVKEEKGERERYIVNMHKAMFSIYLFCFFLIFCSTQAIKHPISSISSISSISLSSSRPPTIFWYSQPVTPNTTVLAYGDSLENTTASICSLYL